MPVIWPRQSARRMMGVFNVREEPYGARPSESAATNVAAIQRALDAANTAGGGTVLLPEVGTYQTSGLLTLYSNVHFKGTGPGTVLALVTASSTSTLRFDGSQGSTSALTASGAIGDISVAITASLSLAAGDYVILDNTGSASYQVSRVSSVSGDGLTVTLTEPLAQAFTTATSSFLRKMTPVSNVRISDLTLDGTNASHADAFGVVAFYGVNLSIERVLIRSYNGSGIFGWGGYGLSLSDVNVDDSGSAGYADVQLYRQGVWSVRNLISTRATGFGPEFSRCHFGHGVDIKSMQATSRALKLDAACFNQFQNVACLNGQSTGLSITLASCDNHFLGVKALHNGSAGGVVNGVGIWMDDDSARNQLLGVDSRFNNVRNLEIDTGANDNVLEGRIDLTGASINGLRNILRTTSCGQVGTAVGSSSGPTTTSASYADLTDMSVTLTTTGGNLIVDAECVVSHSSLGATVTFALLLDSGSEVAARTVEAHTADSPQSVALHHVFTGVSAASHTVKVRWLTSASTATAVTTQRSLRVTEGAKTL